MPFLARLLPLTAALLFAACAPAPPTERLPAHLATVTFDISSDPRTLDPLFAHVDSGSVEAELARLAFEPFLDVDDRGKFAPALLREVPTAANGGVSPDGRTLTYHLRPNVRWSDGVRVTARDVLFTLHAILDPDNVVATRSGYDRIVSAEAHGDDTVVFHLRERWAPAVATFFAYGSTPQFVLPEHVLASQTPLNDAPFGGAPVVGDGPYRFVSWRRGDGLVYAANRRYWRGAPRVGRIDVRIVPDPNTNLALMRSGAIDFNLLAPVQIASVAGTRGVALRRVPSAIVAGLALAVRHAPLDDVRVRRAIAQSIDRAAISRTIALGRYPVADSDRTRLSPAFDDRVREPAYDPEAADRALDAAGWHRGMGGVRVRGGRVAAIEYVLFPESTTGVRVAVFVQQELEARGFLVSITSISNPQLFLPETGTLARGEFDVAYVPWTMGADPDDEFVYGCDGADKNYMRYCNPAVERLEAAAVTARSDVARRALYGRIDRLVAADVPIVWLFRADYTYASRTRLRGFSPNAFGPTWNAWQWQVSGP